MKSLLFLSYMMLFGALSEGGAQSLSLEDYLKKGIQNSPQQNDFRNQIQTGRIDSLKINAARKPQINLLGQILIAPAIGGIGYDQAVTNTGNYELLAGISQNIFNRKILAPQYENIRLQNMGTDIAAFRNEHELRKEITTYYIQAYADNIQAGHALAMLKLLKEENLYLKQLTEKGIYKPFDYAAFQVSIKAQEIAVKQQMLSYRTDISALNTLCGITDTTLPVLVPPQLQPSQPVETNASLFLQSFRIDSLQLINRKLLAGANYKPKLNWFADAGILGSQPSTLYRNFGTSFGINLSVPLYDGHQKNLEFKKVGLAENTRSAYESFFKKQYNNQKSALMAELKLNAELMAQTGQQLTLTAEQIELGKNQLNIGALPVTDFLLAVRNYTEVRSFMSGLQIKQLQILNELNYWNW
ncbi:MAG: TolC family protein [Bacteroidia bacterium]